MLPRLLEDFLSQLADMGVSKYQLVLEEVVEGTKRKEK